MVKAFTVYLNSCSTEFNYAAENQSKPHIYEKRKVQSQHSDCLVNAFTVYPNRISIEFDYAAQLCTFVQPGLDPQAFINP